jgi:hypothetical protein
MNRGLAWLAGGFGLAALLRLRRRRPAPLPAAGDPAAELRRKLDEARAAGDDRPAFEAGERAVDEVEAPPPAAQSSIEERRRAIHEKAQEALDSMRSPGDDG